MAIERVTGGKPQEIRKADTTADRKAFETRKDTEAGKGQEITTDVSARSKAAIKAFLIAQESKPYIDRANKIAELKQKVANGSYHPTTEKVADAIINHTVSGGKSSSF